MNRASTVDVFNRRLDAALGIPVKGEGVEERLDAETQQLLQVAETLARANFDDELLPAKDARKGNAAEALPTRPVQGLLRRRGFALAVIVVVAVLVAGLLAIGPERALAAIGRLLGYIPGVGFVDDSHQLRALPEAVIQEREGINLVVEQAVADSTRTIIVYKVEGLSLEAANSQGEGAATGSSPVLRLPDGTTLSLVTGEGQGWGSGYRQRLVYPPLPPDAETVTFEIPRLMDMPAGAAPEDWEVTLRFVPAPADLTVVPVFNQEPPVSTAQPTASQSAVGADGITLQVDRSVPLEDGYLVEGSLLWDDRYPAEQGVMDNWDMRLTDANGNNVPIEATQPDVTEDRPYRSRWAYRTAGTALASPLTFTMDSVTVTLLEPVSFQIDPGVSPSEGQTWDLSLDVNVLDRPVHIVSARYLERRGMQGFEVVLQGDPALTSFHIGIEGPNGEMVGSAGGGGSRPGESGEITSTVLTDGEIDGPVTLTIRVIGLRGPWTAEWSPPAGVPASEAATPIPEACANPAGGWQQVLSGPPATLPQGVNGRVVGYGPVNGSDQYVVYVSNLDGSELRVLGQGTWPTVSPDGSQTAYSAADGINIADNETGTTTHLPGTVEGDYHPLWSPDASQIAFVRIVDLNIYVVKADGSDLRQLTSGIEYELLAGWSPDGGRLYYTVLSQGGQVLRELGMASGAVRDLFTVGPKDVPSISPEGRRVAFADRVFGGTDFSLFVSSIDGSERRRIADSVADHLWSPDGKWLIVSMSDPDDMFAVPMPVLINVGTCEVTPLRWFSGYIQGWAP